MSKPIPSQPSAPDPDTPAGSGQPSSREPEAGPPPADGRPGPLDGLLVAAFSRQELLIRAADVVLGKAGILGIDPGVAELEVLLERGDRIARKRQAEPPLADA